VGPARPCRRAGVNRACGVIRLWRHDGWQIENRIKEQQLDLFADRTSTHTLRANQLRLYLSTFAYVLLRTLRRLGLQETDLADAQCGTIRTRLLKFGAQIRLSVRRVRIAFSESFPAQALFVQALRQLQHVPIRAAPA